MYMPMLNGLEVIERGNQSQSTHEHYFSQLPVIIVYNTKHRGDNTRLFCPKQKSTYFHQRTKLKGDHRMTEFKSSRKVFQSKRKRIFRTKVQQVFRCLFCRSNCSRLSRNLAARTKEVKTTDIFQKEGRFRILRKR